MATLVVSTGDYMRPYRGPIRVFNRPEGASQTFRYGTPVIFSSTSGHENEVLTAGTDPTYVVGVTSQAASGTQGTSLPVWSAEPDVEFIGRVQDGGTLAYTNVGTAYGIVYDATNTIWRVDLSETTTTSVIVTALVDAVGDINGNVAFQWKAAARKPFAG